MVVKEILNWKPQGNKPLGRLKQQELDEVIRVYQY